ncbi:uncharacterized protein LOC115626406 [Scaptodrosophila lebanonensis]|uniref:Uncharacterized protein LOC115626406 n=1 Tax=Drosophila lebanonensis TaxID=7225 RepID=A0A6J2TM40_DROLE|nr:uncharacterized protein LOC115626406 [Scaptodrosophila lebanonensis]
MDNQSFNTQFLELESAKQDGCLNKIYKKEENSKVSEHANERYPVWSIEDDTLFQPCGLINHSDGAGKSVFVVWNEYYLLNFRLRNSKRGENVDMIKVRVPLPTNGRRYLQAMCILNYNSLLLMSDGHIYCYGSIKSLHIVPWLSGVRCFSRNENGFSVIRHDEIKQRLFLETYADVPSFDKGESTVLSSFDITYDDQNIFNCDWKNDRTTITTLTVTQEDHDFMLKLFGVATIGEQLHIFSIAGQVFALLPQDPDADPHYLIEMQCTYAASVDFVRIFPKSNLCLVYLSCGSVDMWFVSKLTGLKQRRMYFVGAKWLDFDGSSDNGDFYYTDGEQIVRLRYEYDELTDSCRTHRCAKSIPGMVACTYVQHSEQLVCLSENNIFYRIGFSKHTKNNAHGDILKDLTPSFLESLLKDAHALALFEQQPERLRQPTKAELENQRLLAIARKKKGSLPLLEASLMYMRYLPRNDKNTVILHTVRKAEIDSSGIYVTLRLKVNEPQQLLCSNQWQLVVYQEEQAYVICVSPQLLIDRDCCILISLHNALNEKLPEFTMKLVAFVELHSQICAITIPVEVKKTSETYCRLFSFHHSSFNIFNEPTVADIIPNQPKRTGNLMITHKMQVPENTKFDGIFAAFDGESESQDSVNDIYFIDTKLIITSTDNYDTCIFTLQSMNAPAIYYFKLHLVLNEIKCTNGAEDMNLNQQITELQCDIEKFYGTQSPGKEGIKTNIPVYLETLHRAYDKIRNTILKN